MRIHHSVAINVGPGDGDRGLGADNVTVGSTPVNFNSAAESQTGNGDTVVNFDASKDTFTFTNMTGPNGFTGPVHFVDTAAFDGSAAAPHHWAKYIDVNRWWAGLGEIDFDKKIWTVPAERMKAGREHRVPLSSRAVTILRQLEKLKASGFVFAGQARNKPLSNMAMEMALRRMKIEGATVHGFRSSFRDWAGNVSNFPREITETALAHVIGDKTEQAYRRSDALEKRRKLMEAWASYCEPKKAGNVVQIDTRKRAS